MSYLIDTDWIISFLNGRPAAVEFVGSLHVEQIHVSVVSCGEVLEGVQHPDASDKLRQFASLASELSLLPVNLNVAQAYARERARLRATGMLVPENDLWIAATALVHDLQLVSGDQHFSRIHGLKRYSP